MPNNSSSSSTKAPDFKDIKDKVVEGATTAKDTVKNVAQKVGEKADDATAAAGRGIQSVADTMREYTPDSGIVGSAARTVTDTIASGGRYLEHEKLSGMVDDFTDVLRNHPVPALCLAFGFGFLLGRALSSRS